MRETGADSDRHWYVMRTRSNFERRASHSLGGKGIETYLPAVEVPSRRDRSLRIERPLFPGYFFVRLKLRSAEKVAALRTAGVVDLVGFSAGPAPVPDWQVRSIRLALASQEPFELLYQLVPGERVVVRHGPFRGVEGVILEPRSTRATRRPSRPSSTPTSRRRSPAPSC